jgi:hypothetical protein
MVPWPYGNKLQFFFSSFLPTGSNRLRLLLSSAKTKSTLKIRLHMLFLDTGLMKKVDSYQQTVYDALYFKLKVT